MRRISRFSAVLGAAMLHAVAASPVAAQVTPGRVIWHDLVTRNLDVSKAFYSGLFGWTIRAPTAGKDVKYVVMETAGIAMAGIAESRSEKVNSSQWLTYFGVPDLKAAVKAATDAGARVVVAPTRTGAHDESALLTDAQGAPFALMQPHDEPGMTPAPVNGWLWVELWTIDLNAASAFYGNLLGYQLKAVNVAGQDYSLFERDARPMAGLLKIPVPDVRPNWLPTIRVADVNVTVKNAVSLGGRVILAPRADIRNGTVAIIADPTGAAVAVQQWDGLLKPTGKGN